MHEDSLAEFEKLLKAQNWAYEYSPSHVIRDIGHRSFLRILRLKKILKDLGQEEMAQALYDQYCTVPVYGHR